MYNGIRSVTSIKKTLKRRNNHQHRNMLIVRNKNNPYTTIKTRTIPKLVLQIAQQNPKNHPPHRHFLENTINDCPPDNNLLK